MKHTMMKSVIAKGLVPVFALASSAVALAGDTYVEPAPAPAPAPNLWTWFVGGSVNFVDDWDDELWAFHVGMEKAYGNMSHAFYLEIGWAGDNSTETYTTIDLGYPVYNVDGVDIDLLPVTLNYKFELGLFGSDRIHWYAGGGIGILFSDLDWSHFTDDRRGTTTYDRGSEDDEVFFGQLFTGLVWNVSDQLEIYGGGRWMYADKDTDFDFSDNTGAFELGARWNF